MSDTEQKMSCSSAEKKRGRDAEADGGGGGGEDCAHLSKKCRASKIEEESTKTRFLFVAGAGSDELIELSLSSTADFKRTADFDSLVPEQQLKQFDDDEISADCVVALAAIGALREAVDDPQSGLSVCGRVLKKPAVETPGKGGCATP